MNNLSNIYKCKVSLGGTFSLGNFLFDERENYFIIKLLIGAQREKIKFFSSDRERKMAKTRGICASHTCIPQYKEYPPPGRGRLVSREDELE